LAITKKAVDSDICRDKISKLLGKLDIEYNDISLYVLAFIHRSIVNERPDFAPKHNERLEFLGDAVLELSITNNLYRDYPKKTEWDLTDIRSALVRGTNLAKIARKLDFKDYLYLWKWEEAGGGRDNDYLLANVVEAFLWALYLDKWFKEASLFIDKHIYPSVEDIINNNLTKDFKTLIQEYSQAKFEITPNYKIISEKWPDHDKDFLMWVYLWDKLVWKWNWSSKKKSQEQAAKDWYMTFLKENSKN